MNNVKPELLYNPKVFKNTRHIVHVNARYQPGHNPGNTAEQREYHYGQQEFGGPQKSISEGWVGAAA